MQILTLPQNDCYNYHFFREDLDFYKGRISTAKCAQKVQPNCPARARSAWARRAGALRALGLLLADGSPTGGRGDDFLSRQLDFFTETVVTSERKVEKSFPRLEINRHNRG